MTAFLYFSTYYCDLICSFQQCITVTSFLYSSHVLLWRHLYISTTVTSLVYFSHVLPWRHLYISATHYCDVTCIFQPRITALRVTRIWWVSVWMATAPPPSPWPQRRTGWTIGGGLMTSWTSGTLSCSCCTEHWTRRWTQVSYRRSFVLIYSYSYSYSLAELCATWKSK